jgi:hypothetical protein
LRAADVKGQNKHCCIIFLVGLAMVGGVMAGEKQAKPPVPNRGEPTSGATAPMNPEEPMPIGMSKEGMKKGDVTEGAKQKRKYMEEMMQQEKAAADKRGQ